MWSKAGFKNSWKFCQLTNESLGMYNEQTDDTIRFDLRQFWGKLKVPQTKSSYDARLLRTIILYNSTHILY